MLLAGITFMPAIAAVSGRALFWPSKRWTARAHRRPGRPARDRDRPATGPDRARRDAGRSSRWPTAALGTKLDYDLSSSGPSTPASRTADEIAASLPRGATDPQQIYVRSTRALSAAGAGADAPAPGRASTASAASRPPVLTPDRRGARIDLALDVDSTSRRGHGDRPRPAARRRARDRAGGQHRDGGRQRRGLRRRQRLDRPRPEADLPDRGGADRADPGADAAQRASPRCTCWRRSRSSSPRRSVPRCSSSRRSAGGTGVAFTLPLVLFLFVVALGTDYNILMTARLREEMLAGASRRARRSPTPSATSRPRSPPPAWSWPARSGR